MLGNSKEVSPSAAPFVSGAYSAHCLTHMKISRKQRFIFSWLKILFLTSKQSPNECFSILLCMMSYVQGCHLSIKGKSRLRTFYFHLSPIDRIVSFLYMHIVTFPTLIDKIVQFLNMHIVTIPTPIDKIVGSYHSISFGSGQDILKRKTYFIQNMVEFQKRFWTCVNLYSKIHLLPKSFFENILVRLK